MKPLCAERIPRRPETKLLLLCGIFLGILGCGPILGSPTLPSENSFFIDLPLGDLVKRLAQRDRQFQSLRALATVYYWGAEGRGTFQEAILVQRPDRLRLETLSGLGALLIVTVDGAEVVGFHPREATFFRGKSSKENLRRYTQIPLELAEITSLLLGLPPVKVQAAWEQAGGSIYRDGSEGRTERVTFDSTLGIPNKWERLGDYGRVELRAVFSDFLVTPAGPFPQKISLESYLQETRVEIRYQEPEVNVALPLTSFIQEKPANVQEVPLESLGG